MTNHHGQQKITDHGKTKRKNNITQGIQKEDGQYPEKNKGKADARIKSIQIYHTGKKGIENKIGH